jgi:GDP-D-mannose 3',5'-epimerase
MYIDDCVRATQIVANRESTKPVNVGSAELVSIKDLVSIVEDLAGIQLKREYDCLRPQGVRDRTVIILWSGAYGNRAYRCGKVSKGMM